MKQSCKDCGGLCLVRQGDAEVPRYEICRSCAGSGVDDPERDAEVDQAIKRMRAKEAEGLAAALHAAFFYELEKARLRIRVLATGETGQVVVSLENVAAERSWLLQVQIRAGRDWTQDVFDAVRRTIREAADACARGDA